MPRSAGWLARLLPPLLVLACVVLPLEAGLRVLPRAIPLSLLAEFQPQLRSRIAARRNLPRVEDTVLLPRDDGGPPDRLWIYKGGADVTRPYDEPGIVQTVRMDDRGFCNPAADAYEVPAIDVAALGDSLTWCMNVEPQDAWPSRLAAQTALVTYNFGIPGRGLYEHLQILKQFGLAKSPKFVILAVYEGNDLRDAVRYYAERNSAEPIPGLERCPYRPNALCDVHEVLMNTVLARHSYVYNLLLSSSWRAAYRLGRNRINFRYVVTFPDGVSIPFNIDNADREEVGFAAWLRDQRVQPELFDDALRDFLALSREHGFVPIVAYIPSAHTAYADMARFDEVQVAGLMRAYSESLRHYFARQATQLGFRYVDLTPALQQEARGLDSSQLLYFHSNVHLTPRGHEIVARELTQVLHP